MLTLLGWGSAFGLTIWVPGGIMPLGGSLTSTSKPASKNRKVGYSSSLLANIRLCKSPYRLENTLRYLFQCRRWWHGLYRVPQHLESSWHCRFHLCWRGSAYSRWVCGKWFIIKLRRSVQRLFFLFVLSHLPLWGGWSKAQLFKGVVFICLKNDRRPKWEVKNYGILGTKASLFFFFFFLTVAAKGTLRKQVPPV